MERLDGLGGQLVAGEAVTASMALMLLVWKLITFSKGMGHEIFVIKACHHGFNFSPYGRRGIQVY